MSPTPRRPRRALTLTAALALALAGCASVDPAADRKAVSRLVAARLPEALASAPIAPIAPMTTASASTTPAAGGATSIDALIDPLLARPLDADAAVRIALANNPALRGAMAELALSDAERAQKGRLPNPHLSLGRAVVAGDVSIERAIGFDLLALLTLPQRVQAAERQHEAARLAAAQQVLRLAAQTRRAWVRAVAAQQTARYLADAREAAEASAELARRMAQVGNVSRLQQARERVMLGDAAQRHARAEQQAASEREALIRLLGLWGRQAAALTLPERLPDLPAQLKAQGDIEARALAERLDVRLALEDARRLVDDATLQRLRGWLDGLSLTLRRETEFDNAAGTRSLKRGVELDIPLPVFDAGGARQAAALARQQQAAARVHEAAVLARSEAREAWLAWRTAWDMARHQRQQLVPLRQLITEEVLLRYNGMLLSVFDLLAETRNQMLAVAGAIEAERDFWLADADLHLVLHGTSPGALAGLGAAPSTPTAESKGH